MKKQVKGGGVLPYAVHNGEVYLLLGKERAVKGWKDSNKYADFGGKIEAHESAKQGAVRECYEESMGFLGSMNDIRKMVDRKTTKEIYDKNSCSMTYAVKIPYDKTMEKRFGDVYNYFLNCSFEKDGTHVLPGCEHGYYEKSGVKWFPLKELKQKIVKKPNAAYQKQFRTYFVRNLRMFISKQKIFV